MKPLSLGFLDGAILVTYLCVLAFIGWRAARKTKATTDEYFLGGRKIPWLVTTASFLATIISALTFIGSPAEGFGSDYRYLFSNAGDITAAFFVALVFLPVYQAHNVTSIYEYLEKRFGVSVRVTGSAYFLLSRLLASTVRIVAISKVLEVVSGGYFSFIGSVVIVTVVIVSYTVAGGGRAIAWTDLFQFTLLISGALVAGYYIVTQIPGGLGEIISIGMKAVKPDGTVYNKFNFTEMFKPENLSMFFLLAVWGFFQSTAAYGTDQDMVQRLLSCENKKKARWSLMISGIAGIPITFLFLSLGVGLYAYAQYHPELIAGMTDNDHIFPRFMLYALPSGLRGLLLAAVAAAAMGSSDSALASLSTAFVVDFYRRFVGKDADEKRCVFVSKLAVVGFGLLFILFAILFKNLDNLLWLGFRIVAFTYGPLLGVFLVAILTDWKISSGKIIFLMTGITLFFFVLGMFSWRVDITKTAGIFAGAESFFIKLHRVYWRFYVILSALLIPLFSFFLRDKTKTSGG